MHGGATDSGGRSGQRNGNYRHGGYTKQNLARKQQLRNLVREAQAVIRGTSSVPRTALVVLCPAIPRREVGHGGTVDVGQAEAWGVPWD